MVSICPTCHYGVKLSECQMVLGVKLSAVSNGPRIIYNHPKCKVFSKKSSRSRICSQTLLFNQYEQCMAEFQTVPDIRKVTNLWENHEKWTMFHFQAEHLEDKTETEGGSRGRMHHLLVSRTILRKKCISYFEKLSDFESLYRFPEAIYHFWHHDVYKVMGYRWITDLTTLRFCIQIQLIIALHFRFKPSTHSILRWNVHMQNH